jgi:rhomboid domain-containing protein 1
VIFGLIVIDNKRSDGAQRSVLGIFSVPAALYPYALLLFWQLLLPGVSLLGHLSGVLVRLAAGSCMRTGGRGEQPAGAAACAVPQPWKRGRQGARGGSHASAAPGAGGRARCARLPALGAAQRGGAGPP